MNVTGVTTPITNQVETWYNMKAIALTDRKTEVVNAVWRRWKITKRMDCKVVIKIAGTKNAQIEMQYILDISERKLKSKIIIFWWVRENF